MKTELQLIVLELSLRDILELNSAFVELGDFATMASGVIVENHLVVYSIAAGAEKVKIAKNKQYATKDEEGKLLFDQNGQLEFSIEAFDQLQDEWDKHIDETKHTLKFIQFSDDDFKVNILNKQGKTEYKKVEMPPRLLLHIRRHNILLRPENLPENNTENSEPEA